MKKWVEQFKTEDWTVVAVSVLLLGMAVFMPGYLPSIPKHLTAVADWGQAAGLYVIVLVTLCVGWVLLGRSCRGVVVSLAAVFGVSLLAQLTASIPQVAYYGFE
ncbi:MAG: putative sulfate exporter family transporter, partial [Odoribacter sp.]|nr:putative sulfate exporter family transporter [Odoribacter sp.]